MKNQNLSTRVSLLAKSILLSCFLLFAGMSSSSAQYIQIEADYTSNPAGVMQMKVYADAACTIPSVFYGTVKYQTLSYIGCELEEVYTNHEVTVDEFNSASLLHGGYLDAASIRWCEGTGHLEDFVDIFISLLPGWGYSIASTPVVII